MKNTTCIDHGSMSNTTTTSSHDLIDSKLEEHQFLSCQSRSKHCPACGHKLQGKTASDWVGLPAGVKFDPTDQELIEHLEAKVVVLVQVEVEGSGSEVPIKSSHPLIDEFIPTIEGEDGICYTHPEKLPGVTKDGLSRHFFHRPSKAYTTGTRKRRKIQLTECDHLQAAAAGGETRWHKTGKTRPVMANGKQKGCKKILVLYTNFGKNRKPEKTNWVMHQYHLGQHEEEREGELVVSKIFYQTQPRQCNWTDRSNNSITNVIVNTSSTAALEGGNMSHDLMNSSSKEIIIGTTITQPDDQYSSYGAIDHIQQLKADHFSYLPFRKASFDHEAGNIGEASISAIVSPPPPSLHHTSINILDQDHSFSVPTNMLPSDHHFQQEEKEEEQQHHKIEIVGRSSSSGLEELIMGCTSSSTNIKQELPINTSQQEAADWLKYSSFWPDPDNPDHHG